MIKLKRIEIKNFGGIANGEFTFSKDTEIYSASGTGKSSIYLAYMFALGFGVDYEPLIDGVRLHNINTYVNAVIEKNGLEYSIIRENTQKFKLVDGCERFVGNNMKYSIDSQEMTYNKFKEKISEIFETDYLTLELLTSVTMFMEESQRWNKNTRRKFLFKIFDLDSKIKELQSKSQYSCLNEYFLKNLDEIEIKKFLNNQKVLIDNGLQKNNIIIEERQNNIVNNTVDFSALENEKEEILKSIETLGNGVDTSVVIKNDLLNKINKVQNDLSLARNTNDKAEYERTATINKITREIDTIENNIQYNEKLLKQYNSEIDEATINVLKQDETTINENDLYCHTCGQKLPKTKISEVIENFNNRKIKKIAELNIHITECESKIKTLQKTINTLNIDKENKYRTLQEIKDSELKLIDTTPFITEINNLQEQINNIQSDNYVTDKRNELNQRLNTINKELAKQEIINNDRARINNVIAENIKLNQQEQDRLIKVEALKNYSKEKMQLVNEQVNLHFEKVNFNFFHYQGANALNPYEDVCEAMMNNVEYFNMSSGQKVKANYYIGKSLRKILGLNLPQFIDDVVLSDFKEFNDNYQSIYLITDNNAKINCKLVKETYTKIDCVKVGE